MPNKDSRELHGLETLDLEQRLEEAHSNLTNLRFGLVTRKTTNTSGVGEAKRQIARIRTILKEREQEA